MGLTIKVPTGFDYISAANPLPVSLTGAINGVPIGNTTPSTGAFTTLSATGLTVTNGDNPANTRFIGTTRAVRIGHDANASLIEGVDPTGTLSYQPLFVGGSEVRLTVSGAAVATVSSTGLAVTGNISTTDPAGGAGPAWKLGVAASVSPTAPNRTLRVEIGGTTYYIHAKTTND